MLSLLLAGLLGLVPAAPATSPVPPPREVIFHGGAILPMGGPTAQVEALAIRNGRILATGPKAAVLRLRRPTTQVRDLGARALLPGFIDPHLHLLGTAEVGGFVNLHPLTGGPGGGRLDWPGARAKLVAAIEAAAPGTWVAAHGFDPWLLAGAPARFTLSGRELDRLSPRAAGVPILVVNMSGHVAYVNAAGVARVKAETKDGVLYEAAMMGPYVLAAAARQDLTPATLRERAIAFMGELSRRGVTSYNDGAIGGTLPLSEVATLNSIAWDPRATVRVHAWLDGTRLGVWRVLFPNRRGNDRLRVTGLKWWADGSTQGLNAFLTEPYIADPALLPDGPTGKPDHPREWLRDQVKAAAAAGWAVQVHANGDAAIDLVLGIYEELLGPNPRADHRWTVQHATTARADQFARMRRLRVSPSFLMGHVYYWGDAFREGILGDPRAGRLDAAAWASSPTVGGGPPVPFSFHSDSPVTPPNPLLMVQAAVTRTTAAGTRLGPDELRLPVLEALRAVTIHPAWQIRREDDLGSLEPGKLADLVVLDRDPRAVPPAEIGAIAVEETWVGGVPVFVRRPRP
jgi:predicted amidohydrolase YtcJ